MLVLITQNIFVLKWKLINFFSLQELSLCESRLRLAEDGLNNENANLQVHSEALLTKADVAFIFRDEMDAENRKYNVCVFSLPTQTNDDKITFVKLSTEQLGVSTADLELKILEVRRWGSNNGDNSNSPKPLIVKTAPFEKKNNSQKCSKAEKLPTNAELQPQGVHRARPNQKSADWE